MSAEPKRPPYPLCPNRRLAPSEPPPRMVQVGWYCAGGHPNMKNETVGPSVRIDDPCAFGVPMYVLAEDAAREDEA